MAAASARHALARAAEMQADRRRHIRVSLGLKLRPQSLPAREVGGDFYDWRSSHRECSAHCGRCWARISAALLMATVRAVLRALVSKTRRRKPCSAPRGSLQRPTRPGIRDLVPLPGGYQQRPGPFRRCRSRLHRASARRRTVEELAGASRRGVDPTEHREGFATLASGDTLIVSEDGLPRSSRAFQRSSYAGHSRGAGPTSAPLCELTTWLPRSFLYPDDLTVVVLRRQGPAKARDGKG